MKSQHGDIRTTDLATSLADVLSLDPQWMLHVGKIFSHFDTTLSRH